ncbi:MAG TPA: hypothetical protein P5160_09190 [Candidatus Omnitrophota bacterium]|nr:hypothetical protein [Candidatus Omnitrophota bacterium]
MPDTFQESSYKGYPVAKIYHGEYQGEPQFLMLGLKKAQAILENIDRLRQWVEKQERK